MSHNVVIVEFEDRSRLYAINDGGSCQLYRFLVRTHVEAKSWIFDTNRLVPADPEGAENTEETVILEGMRMFSWTVLLHDGELSTVHFRAECSQRQLDAIFVIPSYIGINMLHKALRCHA